jgi:hypothetical protein
MCRQGIRPDRLKSFLYLLLRDELPVGVINRLIEESKRISKIVYFSDSELAGIACRMCNELKGNKCEKLQRLKNPKKINF